MAADLVFVGGKAFLPDLHVEAVSVAVTAGRISEVAAELATDTVGPDTDVVELGGRLLIPGFQDAHVHPVQGGLERLRCDLSPFETEAEYLAVVGEYSLAHPELEWILGAGWMMAAFPSGLPRRERLDDVCPDRPVYLPNRDHHGAWVNSRALELAGIDAATPDPSDGRIERDADGSPTGVLHEGAMTMVGRYLPTATFDDRAQGLAIAQEHLHSLGITAWQDAILGTYSNIVDNSDVYLESANQGRLTAKVVGALWWDRKRGAEQIPELVERRERFTVDRFRPTSVKIMQDGVAENFTAGMTSAYLDGCGHPTDNSGISMVDPVELRSYVTELDRLGFQVHVHAIGDRAVREALDAFETARKANGSSDHRHHIAHIQVIHPDDVPRFAELGVVANMQPLWASHEPQMDELTIPFLGPERSRWQYPFGSLVRSGARLAGGSDWPVSSPNPLWGIHVAVNRAVPPSAGEVLPAFLEHQAVDVATALAAYTAGSAYVNHLDDTGKIQVGMTADLVVLDRDIVSGPPTDIGEAAVDATYVDGVLVYER
jgi:predicted amidohydrolase YtcJ